MNIYGDVLSPFVRACLVAAHEVGLADKIKVVPTTVKAAEENSRLAKLSPIAKIPVLETEHGHAVHDSRVIIEYLAHVAGDRTLIPDDGVKRFRVLTLQSIAAGMAEAAVVLRYELAQRPAGLQWVEFANRQRQRIRASVAELEANWGHELESCNAGSILTATALGYVDFRHGDIDWRANHPNVTAFSGSFSARPSMMAYPLS